MIKARRPGIRKGPRPILWTESPAPTSGVVSRGPLAAGIWDCSKGSFAIPSHATDEMCSILEGEAVIEHADGTRVTVRPGDSFLIPYGTRTIWHVANYVKKAFVCAVPARS